MKFNRIISAITMAAIVVSSTAILGADASTVKQKHYYKYVYETNTRTDYWLTQEDTLPVTSTYVVSGEDERFRDGSDGVVAIKVNRILDEKYGTGFIVDDHVIATAAHCVFHRGNDQFASTHDFFDIEIIKYSNNGISTGINLTPVEAHVPVLFDNTISNYYYPNDYALITVEEDLSEYMHFNLGYAYDAEDDHDIPVLTTGFPLDLNSELEINGYDPLMYTSPGYLTLNPDPIDGVIYLLADTEDGNSGGPVYTITEYTVGSSSYYEYTVIGILAHRGTAYIPISDGTRITSSHIQFYLNNENIGY